MFSRRLVKRDNIFPNTIPLFVEVLNHRNSRSLSVINIPVIFSLPAPVYFETVLSHEISVILMSCKLEDVAVKRGYEVESHPFDRLIKERNHYSPIGYNIS